MKKISFCVVSLGLVALLSTGCKKTKIEPGIQLNVNELVSDDYVPADSSSISVCEKSVGDSVMQLVDVSRVYKASDDVFLSVNAELLRDDSESYGNLAALIDSVYSYATDQKVVYGKISDVGTFAAAIDSMGRNFMDSIVPTTDDSILKAFNVTVDIRPVYKTDKYVTYKVFTNFFTGGAHPVYDCYFTTVGYADNSTLDFDSIVKKEYQPEMRRAIVETIARSEGLTVDEYLANLNDFLNNDAGNKVTIENFPVYNVGIDGQGVVFSYPMYSIAPASSGVLVFEIPLASVAEALAI